MTPLLRHSPFLLTLMLGLAGCNSESNGGSSKSSTIDTGTLFCQGGICTLDSGVALNDSDADVIESELSKGNLILKASNSEALTLSSAVEWTSGHSLTLQASNDIHIQGGITASSGKLILDNPGHTYHLRKPVNLSAGQKLRINGEDFTVITELGEPGSMTAADLQGMNGNLNANYALGADIEAFATSSWSGGEGFLPIAFSNSNLAFNGDFAGLGHQISGLTVDRNSPKLGLFSVIKGTTIKDLALVDIDISGDGDVAGFAGETKGQSRILGSCVYGGYLSATGLTAGGLVGQSGGSLTIADSCVAKSYIISDNYAGGFIGIQDGTTSIEQSYMTASLAAQGGGMYQMGVFSGASYGTVTMTENLHRASTAITVSFPSGSTELSDSNMGELAPFTNANWDISGEADQNTLWFLDVATGQWILPTLRVFDIDMTAYNYNP